MSAVSATAPAKVYYTNLRTHGRESQLDKLKRLIRRAGIEQIDFENKFVAIKIHFGELGNLSFLRPNYARAVATWLRSWAACPSSPTATRCTWAAARTRSSISTARTKTASPRMPRAARSSSPTASKVRTRRSFQSRTASTCRSQDRPRPHGRRHRHQPHALQGA